MVSFYVANSTYNTILLTDPELPNDAAVPILGRNFSGCMLAGPGLLFSDKYVRAEKVTFGTCPLAPGLCQPDERLIDIPIDYCINKPCMTHGQCISREKGLVRISTKLPIVLIILHFIATNVTALTGIAVKTAKWTLDHNAHLDPAVTEALALKTQLETTSVAVCITSQAHIARSRLVHCVLTFNAKIMELVVCWAVEIASNAIAYQDSVVHVARSTGTNANHSHVKMTVSASTILACLSAIARVLATPE